MPIRFPEPATGSPQEFTATHWSVVLAAKEGNSSQMAGVLLYEPLTGTTPFGFEDLLKAGLDQMRRIIREQEHLRPSTRASTINSEAHSGRAASMKGFLRKTDSEFDADLDWIAMMCFEKDSTRRYETANGVAMDTNTGWRPSRTVIPYARFESAPQADGSFGGARTGGRLGCDLECTRWTCIRGAIQFKPKSKQLESGSQPDYSHQYNYDGRCPAGAEQHRFYRIQLLSK